MLIRRSGEGLIPSISPARLNLLVKWVLPVVRFAEVDGELVRCDCGELYFIETVHHTNAAYLDSPIPTTKAPSLLKVCDVTTYHFRGLDYEFRPTIAEVIAQLPDEYLKKVIAFEIIQFPRNEQEAWEHPEAFEEGYLVATTRFYNIIPYVSSNGHHPSKL